MSGETMLPCSCCGELVALSDMEYSFTFPDAYLALDNAARCAPDTFCDANFCTIGGGPLFVRGVIPLPVEGGDDYCIGAWVELAEHDWRLARMMWDEPGNDRVPEFAGTLANHIPRVYEFSTLGLELRVQLHDDTRPTFRLVDSGHPLEDEQRQGITPHRAAFFTGLPDLD